MAKSKKVKTFKADKILALLAQGKTANEIAKKVGVTTAYVYNIKSKSKKVDDEVEKIAKEEVKKTGNRPMTKKELDTWVDEVLKAAETPDMVNHPPHYKIGGIETIDFIEAKRLSYNLGNVVKYISRADHKGSKLEDLEKARFYLDREVYRVKP